ncbi:spore coat associated protein CotJA [uncultured Tyzzerella sp.]|uniref:spore coat associated protein CotJA n=1 Tax=uncultured Tyzzerella sp. TaxID=2321398 RepID=UPI0029438479|nr:spore coat associated protein CotJA [uncultured Tyzzerella sp.]
MNCDRCMQNTGCIPYEEYIKVDELARAYVPFQKLCSIYDKDEAMVKGTIFPELASPYCKKDKNNMKENQCFFKNI